MTSRRPLLALAALALLPGCGHKGDPLPPLRRTPPAPTDFRLAQRGDVLELEATAPAASIDGVAFDRLALEFLYGEGEVDLEKRGRRRLAQGAPGQRIRATVPLPAPGTLVRATALGVSAGHRGARTVTKALVAQPPLEPPRELSAGADDEGVHLSWQGLRPQAVEPPTTGPRPPGAPSAPRPFPPGAAAPPAAERAAPPSAAPAPTPAAAGPPTAPPPEAGPAPEPSSAAGAAGTAAVAGGDIAEPPRRNGFFVYRREGDAPYAGPLTAEPLERRNTNDADVPLGERVCYVVRAVASTDPLIESAPSNEACAVRRDTTAPETPAGLAILPRPDALEVLWSPSAEADLAGYRVYRESAGEARRRLAELGPEKAAYVDETAARGVAYRYTVTAIDQSGNESEPALPVEAVLP
jgi:hypothetical protein